MRNKRKGILMASAILGSAAIVSTGFAAWVITTPTTASVQGNIEVDTVTDNRINMTASWETPNTGDAWTVKFGATNQSNASAWLTNNDDSKVESITNKLNISLSWKTEKDDEINGTIKVDFKVGTIADGVFTQGVNPDSTLITLPSFSAEYEVSDGVVEDIPVNFGWGSYFADINGAAQNPYDYFNTKMPNDKATNHALADGTRTWADVAIKALQDLDDISSQAYKITLTFDLTEPNV